METNSQLDLARAIIEKTGRSLFLTGRAGTGKTTFLRDLQSTSRKRMVVTAPTGIAAINAGGVTLHSFFQLDFGPFVPGMRRKGEQMAFRKDKLKIIRGLDLLVIDEVSMVRADLLDAVDDALRRIRRSDQPFGGVQLLLIGDLQQLPPVVVESERQIMAENYRSPYFFDSHALSKLDYVTVELTRVYRQSDAAFLDLLNAVRENRLDNDTLARLNSRCIPGFNPPDEEGYVRLTTHNRLAADINAMRMGELEGEPYVFDAEVKGNFPESMYPADSELLLKEGAQVMFLKNDTGGDRQFFNGMMGIVTSISHEGVGVTPVDTGEEIQVAPLEWENVSFVVEPQSNEVVRKVDGVFRQIPLKAAWAITIHKSQGLTFDRAIIDASLAFAHGQTYVALSRCRTLEGLVLERPLSEASVKSDHTVDSYLDAQKVLTPDESQVSEMTRAYTLRLVEDMFDFHHIFNLLEMAERTWREHFQKVFTSQVGGLVESVAVARREIKEVGDRFRVQLQRIAGDEQKVGRRVKDASAYFLPKLRELAESIGAMPTQHDSKQVTQKLAEQLEALDDVLAMRMALVEAFATEDFSLDRYLDIKAQGAFRDVRKRPVRKAAPEPVKTADNVNPELYRKLCVWRRELSNEMSVPAYIIASSKVLLGVSNYVPADSDTLARIPGVGAALLQRYGEQILAIVGGYVATASDVERLPIPEPKPKLAKGETFRISYNMFMQQGKSVPEIASERKLQPSTIYGHITKMCDINDPWVLGRLVPEDMQKAMNDYFDSHEELPSMASLIQEELKSAYGVEADNGQIRIMMTLLDRRSGKSSVSSENSPSSESSENS